MNILCILFWIRTIIQTALFVTKTIILKHTLAMVATNTRLPTLLQNTGKKVSLILINVPNVIKVPTKTTSVMKADQRKRITEKTIINGNPAIHFSKHKIFTQSVIVIFFSYLYVITI